MISRVVSSFPVVLCVILIVRDIYRRTKAVISISFVDQHLLITHIRQNQHYCVVIQMLVDAFDASAARTDKVFNLNAISHYSSSNILYICIQSSEITMHVVIRSHHQYHRRSLFVVRQSRSARQTRRVHRIRCQTMCAYIARTAQTECTHTHTLGVFDKWPKDI